MIREEQSNRSHIASITFKEGNDAHYGQDFHFLRGVPSGVKFQVVGQLSNKKLILEAPGYGRRGDYGNGHIFLFLP